MFLDVTATPFLNHLLFYFYKHVAPNGAQMSYSNYVFISIPRSSLNGKDKVEDGFGSIEFYFKREFDIRNYEINFF